MPRPSVWTALRALASVLAIVRIAGAARRRPPLDRRDADIAGSFPVADISVELPTISVVVPEAGFGGDVAAHQRWMVRSVALTFAAVTLRLCIPLSVVLGLPFEPSYQAIAWLCWVPNLMVAEWACRRRGM